MRASIFRLLIVVPVWYGSACGCSGAASGQAMVDIYGGLSLTADDTVHREDLGSVPTREASRDVSYDPSFTVGARLGWWFADNFGLALDGSYFTADSEEVENIVVSLSLLLMARMHLLQDDGSGQGRLQPYVAVGPGVFITRQHADFRPEISEPLAITEGNFGVDARAGLRWLFSDKFGLFTEYRLTHFNAVADNGNVYRIVPTTQKMRATLTTHHLLAGFTFAF